MLPNDCPIERHYLTLPQFALTILGRPPNGLFFPNRHTMLLSSPDSVGELEGIVVNERLGLGLINMNNPGNTLREQGIYQNGADTVLLKQPVRNVLLDMTVKGSDRTDFLLNREYLGYILGVDQATQVDFVDLTDLGDPFQTPLPWTYTHESGLGRRHFDFAIAWMDNDGDIDDPSNLQNDFQLTLSGDDPTFYGDEVVLAGTTTIEATVAPDPNNPPPVGAYVIPEIFYEGNARTCFRLTLNTGGVRNTDVLYALGLIDLSSGRYHRFEYVNFPTDGWGAFTAVGRNRLVWDTCAKHLVSINATTGQFITQLDLSASPSGTKNWNVFQFVPKRTYAISLEMNKAAPIAYELSYFPRYGMI